MKWNASPGQNVRKYPRRSVVTQLSHVSSTRPERAVAPSPGHRPGLLRTQTCRPVRAKALKKQVINNAFALTGRIVDCYYTQGDALGYGLLGFQPVSTVQVEKLSIWPAEFRKQQIQPLQQVYNAFDKP